MGKKNDYLARTMKRICGDNGDFVPFEKRYDWLPEFRYGHKP